MKRWAAGALAAAIAAELGCIKNMVIGKVRRLRLEKVSPGERRRRMRVGHRRRHLRRRAAAAATAAAFAPMEAPL